MRSPPTTTVNTILTFHTAERSDASVVGGRTPPYHNFASAC